MGLDVGHAHQWSQGIDEQGGLRNSVPPRRSASTGSEGAAWAAPRAPTPGVGSFVGRGRSAPSPPAAWAGPPPGLPGALREGQRRRPQGGGGGKPLGWRAKCAVEAPCVREAHLLTCSGYWGATPANSHGEKKNNRTLVPSAFLSLTGFGS